MSMPRPSRPVSSKSDSNSNSSPNSDSSTKAKAKSPKTKTPAVPRPSSSVLLISPQNEILLLHRVQSSTSFPSAHVFPGGNLDPFHDGAIPEPDTPGRHVDGPAYRLGAVRECFEETGILLAKSRDGSGRLVDLPQGERDEARRRVHANEVPFAEWLASINAEADLEGLLPFTRWITPSEAPKRFTTQMYLYLLPLSRATSSSSSSSSSPSHTSEMLIPTPDGGIEHTAAAFATPQAFLSRAVSGEIILFPPQFYLLSHLTRYLQPPSKHGGSIEDASVRLAAQRAKLLSFLRRVPAAETPRGKAHGTANIGWGDKVIGPRQILVRADKKIVMGLEKPGRELEGTERGGDWERVVLFRQSKGGPVDLEVQMREDVLKEEREKTGGESRDSKL